MAMPWVIALCVVTPGIADTMPVVATGAAQSVSDRTAFLEGSVSGSVWTSCEFEYGPTPGLGSALPCAVGQPLPDRTPVRALLTGLTLDTTYYYRLAAANAAGTSYGATSSFRTLAEARPEFPTTATAPSRTRAGSNGGAGVYVAFCPAHRGRHHAEPRAHRSNTSHAGWPPKQCLKMDKGPPGEHHTLVGQRGVHNWLLGGYGDDTIIGGDRGDVIWGDYHPNEKPAHQTVTIHAGNGRNVIYANDTVNYVWTGTNPGTVVHAFLSGTSGTIHCQSSGIVVFLSKTSARHFRLDGCDRISHYSVGY